MLSNVLEMNHRDFKYLTGEQKKNIFKFKAYCRGLGRDILLWINIVSIYEKSYREILSRFKNRDSTDQRLFSSLQFGTNENYGFALINNFMSVALTLELLGSNNMLSESHVDDLMKVLNILK